MEIENCSLYLKKGEKKVSNWRNILILGWTETFTLSAYELADLLNLCC